MPHYMVSDSNHTAFMSSFDLAVGPSFNEHPSASSRTVQPSAQAIMYQENHHPQQQEQKFIPHNARRGSLPEILPPLRSSSANSMVTLPSISAFDDHSSTRDSPLAVLRRLKSDSSDPA
jgi:hypothetical protein